jgi:ribosomal protein L27
MEKVKSIYILLSIYENRTMKPGEIIIRGKGTRENEGEGDSN